MSGIQRKAQAILGGNIASAANNVEGPFGSQAGGAVSYNLDPDVIQDITNNASRWLSGLFSGLIQTGGGVNSPTYQTLQAVLLVITRQLAYILSRGIPEWDSTEHTPYNGGDIVRRSPSGDQMTLYQVKSGATNITSDPLVDTNNWQPYNPVGTSALIPKAWVVFDGTTTPPTILSSANIASLIRNTDGTFRVDFMTPLGANPGMCGNSLGLVRIRLMQPSYAIFDTAILSGSFQPYNYPYNSILFYSQ